MFVVHDTLPNQEKWKKIQCPPIKSPPFSKGNGLFPKIRVYHVFTSQEMQKNTFYEWIFNQKL